MKIITFGKGERLKRTAEMLEKAPALSAYHELAILPIPTTKDGVHLTGSDTTLEELAATLGDGAFVLGYGIPEAVVERLEDRGAVVCDALGDEIFLEENATLTAFGMVGIILTSAKKSPSEMKIGIIGYGRIGRQLLRILLFLGVSVRVYTHKSSTRLDLSRLGIDAALSSEGDYGGLDYLINTAPDRVLCESEARLALDSAEVIDLASGENFPEGLPITKLGGIPGLMYPLSAGRIYAEAALRYEGGEGAC